ncbi:MAG: hypothetical protein GXO98_06935 [Nitrospirae bacterium]|nr:hypothetical protein [Nitrospirota bacterium]
MTQIIDEIRKTEEESEQIIRTARKEVTRIVEKAKSKGNVLLAEAEREAKKEAASLREKAVAEAEAEAELIWKKENGEAEKLNGTAGKNLDEAVLFIVKKIIP